MFTKYWLIAKSKLAQEKNVVRLTDHLNMTIAVDWDFKLQIKTLFIITWGWMYQ